jgi:hypothetical protein
MPNPCTVESQSGSIRDHRNPRQIAARSQANHFSFSQGDVVTLRVFTRCVLPGTGGPGGSVGAIGVPL